jgi:hypothetical protein
MMSARFVINALREGCVCESFVTSHLAVSRQILKYSLLDYRNVCARVALRIWPGCARVFASDTVAQRAFAQLAE